MITLHLALGSYNMIPHECQISFPVGLCYFVNLLEIESNDTLLFFT